MCTDNVGVAKNYMVGTAKQCRVSQFRWFVPNVHPRIPQDAGVETLIHNLKVKLAGTFPGNDLKVAVALEVIQRCRHVFEFKIIPGFIKCISKCI